MTRGRALVVALGLGAIGCGGGAVMPLTGGGDGDVVDASRLDAMFDVADAPDANFTCAPFTHFPLAIDPDPRKSDLQFIVPLGNLNPPGHVFPTDHVYLAGRLVDPNNPDGAMVDSPVAAPGDATVTGIFSVEHHFTGPNSPPDHTDYSLYFMSCPALVFYFQHLGALSPELAAETTRAADQCDSYTAGADNVRRCQWYVSHAVTAGTLVARASTIHQWIDFGAYDARMPALAYANPARDSQSPDGIDLLHVACPLDYFTSSIASAIRPYMGLDELRRTVDPLCGQVNQDIRFSAAGRWYSFPTPQNPDDDFPEDPHLALVHDNIDPHLNAFSFGTSVPSLSGRVFTFQQYNNGDVNRDFGSILAGGAVCFDGLTGPYGDPLGEPSPVLVIALHADETLDVSVVPNATSCFAIRDKNGQFPMPSPVRFYR